MPISYFGTLLKSVNLIHNTRKIYNQPQFSVTKSCVIDSIVILTVNQYWNFYFKNCGACTENTKKMHEIINSNQR